MVESCCSNTYSGLAAAGSPLGDSLILEEQPDAAVERELIEEVGLKLESIQLFTTRVFKRPNQLEIVFRCRALGAAKPRSLEVSKIEWFAPDKLPEALPTDQKKLIQHALAEI